MALITVTTITHPERDLIFMFSKVLDNMGIDYTIDNVTDTWRIEVYGGCPAKYTDIFLEIISLYSRGTDVNKVDFTRTGVL